MPTNTWDSTVPAGSRLRSLGDDDIRQLKLDLLERLAAEHVSGDGTIIEAADFTEARHKLSSIGLLGLLKGLRIEQRSYATSGNITIFGRLQIEINGDMCYLNSNTNLAFSGLTASTSYYIYVASPGHETEIVAGNLSYSTTAPTYDTARKGWYMTGNLRAIGFFRVDSSSKMYAFVQDSQYIFIGGGTQNPSLVASGTSTSFVEVTGLPIPVFVGSILHTEMRISTNTNSVTGYIYTSIDGTEIHSVFGGVILSTSYYISGHISIGMTSTNTFYYKVYTSAGVVTVFIDLVGFNIGNSL